MPSNQQVTAHVGSKRNRQLRSNAGANAGGEAKRGKTKPDTSKVSIFLRKTYDMIDNCDPAIASWTEDGDMFVVKNQSIFEKEVIPKYFDHSNFSSFTRQLNFYGFKRIPAKPIRNEDIDQETLKHITVYNENFRRGHRDLMIKIQRSTKTGGNLNAQEQQKEIETLKQKVVALETALKQKVVALETQVHQLYQIISSGYVMRNSAGPPPSAANAAIGGGGGYGGVPMEVGGQPSPQAQDYYDQRTDSGDPMSPEGDLNGDGAAGGSDIPTSIAVHAQPPYHQDHNMAPQRVSSNGDVDRKPPASTNIDTMNTPIATMIATLPWHNAKGGLPNDMPDPPAELERGVSSLSLLRGLSSSLLRGLSSGFDPNLSMGGSFPCGISIDVNSPQGDGGGGGGAGHDPNDPMFSNFDKKFFTTLNNDTTGGGGGIRVSSK